MQTHRVQPRLLSPSATGGHAAGADSRPMRPTQRLCWVVLAFGRGLILATLAGPVLFRIDVLMAVPLLLSGAEPGRCSPKSAAWRASSCRSRRCSTEKLLEFPDRLGDGASLAGHDALPPPRRRASAPPSSPRSRLAGRHRAVNLGQGFPDFDGPDEVKAAAVAAIGREQPVRRRRRSGRALRRRSPTTRRASTVRRSTRNRWYVTSGATEAIFDAVLALVDPGDEVILFEPFYDCYAAERRSWRAAAVRPCRLRLPTGPHVASWFDSRALRAALHATHARRRRQHAAQPHRQGLHPDELRSLAELCVARRRRCSPTRSTSTSPSTARRHVSLATLRHAGAHGHRRRAGARPSPSPAGRSAGRSPRRRSAPPSRPPTSS